MLPEFLVKLSFLLSSANVQAMPDQSSGEWESFLSNLELKYPLETKLAFQVIAQMEQIWKEVRPHETMTDKLGASTKAEGTIESSMLFHVLMVAMIKYFLEMESIR